MTTGVEHADSPSRPPTIVISNYDIESPIPLDTCEDGQRHSMPLGVELTGYRLLTTSIILGLGIPKAVYSYHEQSLVSPTLDWVAGTLLALM